MPNTGKNRKNGKYALLDRRQRVAELYLRGFSQVKIANQLACSQPTISNDLASLREQWLGSALRDFNQRKAEELAKLDALEREAWTAWERSCKDTKTCHKRTEAVRMPAKGARGKSTAKEQARLVIVKRIIEKTRKGQTGDPRFLERVAWCIETRLKLMGLMRNQTDVRQVVNIDWDAMAGRPYGPEDGPVERMIAEALGQPANDPPVNRLVSKASSNGDGHE